MNLEISHDDCSEIPEFGTDRGCTNPGLFVDRGSDNSFYICVGKSLTITFEMEEDAVRLAGMILERMGETWPPQ